MERNKRYEYIMNRVREHWDVIQNMGYEVVGIFLQGSQNYGLDIYDDDYKSDIDTKAIVLPSFQNFVESKEPVSHTVVMENNEHCDVKDIRIMFETFKKCNVNFLEILFTQYYIINSKYVGYLIPLWENKEKLAFANITSLLNAISGMAMQKYIALKHPYPTIKSKIDKYGYDPKQLHHIYRMNQFIKRIVKGEPFSSCLRANNAEELIKIKKGVQPLEIAEKNAKELVEETENIKRKYLETHNIEIDTNMYKLYSDCKLEILTQWFKEQLS